MCLVILAYLDSHEKVCSHISVSTCNKMSNNVKMLSQVWYTFQILLLCCLYAKNLYK